MRITGANVSCKTSVPITPPMPEAMAMTIKIHLNPIVSAMKPPATGPKDGPRSGPSVYTAMAVARSRVENKSPMTPPPIAIGALPPKPAVDGCGKLECPRRKNEQDKPKKRKAISEPVFGANAHTRLNTRKQKFEMCRTFGRIGTHQLPSNKAICIGLHTHLRPQTSVSGLKKSGPVA